VTLTAASLTRLVFFGLSAAGLAGVAAAGVEVTELQPVVSQQEPELPRQRHRLPHVREKGTYNHRSSLADELRDLVHGRLNNFAPR
jgi:hypothetical protein